MPDNDISKIIQSAKAARRQIETLNAGIARRDKDLVKMGEIAEKYRKQAHWLFYYISGAASAYALNEIVLLVRSGIYG